MATSRTLIDHLPTIATLIEDLTLLTARIVVLHAQSLEDAKGLPEGCGDRDDMEEFSSLIKEAARQSVDVRDCLDWTSTITPARLAEEGRNAHPLSWPARDQNPELMAGGR